MTTLHIGAQDMTITASDWTTPQPTVDPIAELESLQGTELQPVIMYMNESTYAALMANLKCKRAAAVLSYANAVTRVSRAKLNLARSTRRTRRDARRKLRNAYIALDIRAHELHVATVMLGEQDHMQPSADSSAPTMAAPSLADQSG